MASDDDLYRANPAREIEQIAVRTVSVWLGDRGVLTDQSSTGEPDFSIEYNDGRRAVGEVTWHEDEQIQKMWKAVFKRPSHQIVPLQPGQGQWGLRLVRGAHIGELYRGLPAFISNLNDQARHHVEPEYLPAKDPVRATSTSLGIEYLFRVSDDEPPQALFFLPTSGGVVPTDRNAVVDWIDQVITDPAYSDLTRKLLAKDAADERHVFIMSGTQTEFSAGEQLKMIGSMLPDRAPAVPEGITHVWVVSRWTDPNLGAYAGLWMKELGWFVVPVVDPFN